jgi:hypothetical protein
VKWFSILIGMLLSVGCVQVDNGDLPGPVDTKPDVSSDFALADKDIVAKLLAAPELKDSALLRKYAAYCKGAAELIRNQKDVPLTDILTGVKKSNAVFIGVRSPTLAQIAVGLMPESGGAESDRDVLASKWDVLSVSCHAAAHDLDKLSTK